MDHLKRAKLETGVQKPNFFILGAPKCGTTALATYLAEHPNILFSRPKEPAYFCRRVVIRRRQPISSDQEYLNVFFGHGEARQYQAVGEATVWNLYVRTAVPEILRFNPDSRFIVMLRHPFDFVHSLHSQYVFQGAESLTDLREAWEACELRRRGEYKSTPYIDTVLLLYDELAAFGLQVERLCSLVPRDRVKVVLMSELNTNPEAVYYETLKFLNVDKKIRTTFGVINKTHYVRNRFVLEVLRSRLAIAASLAAKRILRLQTLGVGRVAQYPSPELRRIITRFFREDINRLADCLGRDLSAWHQC
jgi:hypothetical protein